MMQQYLGPNGERQEVTAHPPKRWELDRRVPLALILTVVCILVAGIWWVGSLDGRLSTNAAKLHEHDRRISSLELSTRSILDRLVRVETLMEQVLLANGEIREMVSRILAAIQGANGTR